MYTSAKHLTQLSVAIVDSSAASRDLDSIPGAALCGLGQRGQPEAKCGRTQPVSLHHAWSWDSLSLPKQYQNCGRKTG